MGFIKSETRIFLAALSSYTRIPVSYPDCFTTNELNKSIRYLPLIGIFVGAVGALVFSITYLICRDAAIAVIASLIATILTTGAFHEDGLADFADGFGGGWTKTRILEIMKDSHIGVFGTIALILILGIKILLLFKLALLLGGNTYIGHLEFGVLYTAAHSLSRAITVFMIRYMKYARTEDSSKVKSLVSGIGQFDLAFAFFTALLPLVLLTIYFHKPWIAFTILPLSFFTYYLTWYFKKWIGGYTGDCLGATQQLTEVLFYLVLTVLWNFTW